MAAGVILQSVVEFNMEILDFFWRVFLWVCLFMLVLGPLALLVSTLLSLRRSTAWKNVKRVSVVFLFLMLYPVWLHKLYPVKGEDGMYITGSGLFTGSVYDYLLQEK